MIITAAYTLLFSWLLNKQRFVKSLNLGIATVVILYLCKIFAGIAYAFYFKNTNTGLLADTWNFHELSLKETKLLLQNPLGFLQDIWVNNYQQNQLFVGQSSIYNNLKTTLFVKLLGILNVFTGKSYYANLVILNFIFLLGNMTLYKLLLKGYTGNKWLLIFVVFLLPNFLFWQSGLHKDGLVFTLICFFVYAVSKLIENGIKLKYCLIAIVAFSLVFLIKNYVALLIVPALLVFILSIKLNARKVFITLFTLIVCFCLFWLFNGFEILAHKRAEFLQLKSNTLIAAPQLNGNLKSVFQFLPSALSMSLLQPKFWQAIGSFAILAGLHQLGVIVGLGVLIYLPKKNKKNTALIAFCIVFGCLLWLLNGYIIPFAGAIIRYNSVVLPFVFGGLVSWVSPQFSIKRLATR